MPHVELASDIAAVARAVRALGDDRTIVKEMSKTIKRDVGALARPAHKDAALSVLPRRGGLAAYVAKSRITVVVRRADATAGVDVKATRSKAGGKVDLPRIDAGQLRHPVLGNRRVWVTQKIRPGYVSETMLEALGDEAVEAVAAAVETAFEAVERA